MNWRSGFGRRVKKPAPQDYERMQALHAANRNRGRFSILVTSDTGILLIEGHQTGDRHSLWLLPSLSPPTSGEDSLYLPLESAAALRSALRPVMDGDALRIRYPLAGWEVLRVAQGVLFESRLTLPPPDNTRHRSFAQFSLDDFQPVFDWMDTDT